MKVDVQKVTGTQKMHQPLMHRYPATITELADMKVTNTGVSRWRHLYIT